MKQRTNPWPAFADLFSATLIATFAGMVMMTAAYQQELGAYQQREQEVNQARSEADNIIAKVKESLERDSAMKGITRRCGDDTCIDLYIHFQKDKSKIADDAEMASLRRAGELLKEALDLLPSERRKDIEVIIEGHTDDTQPEGIADEREKYLYNWNLSAGRAASVAYEFRQIRFSPPDYQIVAIGYADSMPLCPEDTLKCRTDNRRTTLRLRGDTRQIEKRLGRQQGLPTNGQDR